MPRQPKPADLVLLPPSEHEAAGTGPRSSPIDLQGVDLSSLGGPFAPEADATGAATANSNSNNTSNSNSNSNSKPSPLHPSSSSSSPPLSPRLFDRGPSRNFFGNFKAKRSPPPVEEQQQQRTDTPGSNGAAAHGEELRPGTSSLSKVYHLRKAPGSTPELSLVAGGETHRKTSSEHPVPPIDARHSPRQDTHDDSVSIKKKDKTFRNPLVRSKSIRRDSNSKSKPAAKEIFDQPPMTAPLQSDWPGAEARMFGKGKESNRRGKSAERGMSNDSEENLPATLQHKDSKTGFKTSSKNALSKAKSSGGGFLSRLGKLGRTGSSNVSNEKEKEVPDNEYVFRVINLPLVEQTRITRISKHINACRDKTEFWMPSLPWRCIDYLNSKCEVEGLYRVPGSGPQVKRWQRRFDTELDVDILKEDTYDVNEIASMLKAWLRELPTEIFPAARQKELAAKLEQENPKYKNVGEPAPQLLRDALSELPPFNYYLLFAITCHLSLILGHKEQNRMDLNNLAVCVGPCLNLDRWLFNYLVGDWRNCWRGCSTEKAAQEVEKRIAQGNLNNGAPSTGSDRSEADRLRQNLQREAQSRHGQAASGAGASYNPASSSAILDDAGSVVDDPAVSSASASVASKPNSSHHANNENAKPFFDATAPKPQTYIPAGAATRSPQQQPSQQQQPSHQLPPLASGLGVLDHAELRRPSSSAGPQNGGAAAATAAGDATDPNSTPRGAAHRRSHSDITKAKAAGNAFVAAAGQPPLPAP